MPTDGHARPFAAGDLVAGRFAVDSIAGEGGMGVVLGAIDRTTGVRVALKVLHTRSAPIVERFGREARVLADLVHPGIVRYIAHGTTDRGEPYLAMEWLEGEDLGARLARGPLALADALALGRAAASALGAAHARGVVHRDVKPANLFLVGGAPTAPRVLDFGIARLDEAELARTKSGVVMGTLGYMAPEQARGARSLDARADVFALGCVLFESLTGRPTFGGDNLMAVLAKILLEDAPRLAHVLPGAPRAIDELVASMLSKDPDGRPADGAAVAARIAELADADLVDRRGSMPPSLAAQSLGRGEQSLVTIIVAAPRRAPSFDGDATALDPGSGDTVVDGGGLASRIERVVAPFGGRVDALAEGSIVTALPPVGAATDQAARAAECALAIRAELRCERIPVALATGWGVVHERLPVGEVIDRVARTLSARATDAEAGVRVDRLTADLLRDRFELVEDGGLTLLVRRVHLGVAVERTLLGRPSPCVGRERELRALADFYDECVNEPMARAVLVTAPAGTGKSRLREEFTRSLIDPRADAAAPGIYFGRADAVGAGAPFAIAADALLAAIGRDESFHASTAVDREEALRARLLRMTKRHADPARGRRIAEFLGEIVGARFDDAASPELRAARRDAVLMGDQLARAFEDQLAVLAAAHPVVLILEDLHWGDGPSVKLVAGALRALADRPFMVLALARPEVHDVFPGLWVEHGLQEIRLGPLSKKAAAKLVESALPEARARALTDQLVARSAGNAFYLEELIRAVADGQGDALPESVLAMVHARLGTLDADSRRLLRAASVFGESFSAEGVAALVGGGADAAHVDASLAALAPHEIVAPEGARGAGRWAFRHALLRDGAYAMLTATDRVTGHRLAGAFLAASGERDAALLAEHFDLGEDAANARAAFGRAALQALEGNDFAAAARMATRALDLGVEGEALAATLQILAEAHRWRGAWADAEAAATRAAALAGPDSVDWFRAGEIATYALDMQGRLDAIHAWIDEGARRAPPDPNVEAAFWGTVTRAFNAKGGIEPPMVTKHLHALHGRLGDLDVLSVPRVLMWKHVNDLWNRDDVPLAPLDGMRAAIDRLEASGDLRNAAHFSANLAYLSQSRGDFVGARDAARAASAAAARLGLHHIHALSRLNLGEALAELGEAAAARAELEASVAAFDAQRNARLGGAARVALGGVVLGEGDVDRADRLAIEALDASTSEHIQIGGLTLRAWIALARGDAGTATRRAREAIGHIAASWGAPGLRQQPRTALVEALQASGDHAAARAALDDAIARVEGHAVRFERAEDAGRFRTGMRQRARLYELRRAAGS